jgi:hypothetical protein
LGLASIGQVDRRRTTVSDEQRALDGSPGDYTLGVEDETRAQLGRSRQKAKGVRVRRFGHCSDANTEPKCQYRHQGEKSEPFDVATIPVELFKSALVVLRGILGEQRR